MLLKKRPHQSKKGFKKRRQSWRKYQSKLKRSAARKNSVRKFCKCTAAVLFIFFVYTYLVMIGPGEDAYHEKAADKNQEPGSSSAIASPLDPAFRQINSKKDVQALLDSKAFANIREKSFDFVSDRGERFLVDTTINNSLQNFILESADLSTSQYIGIVVMDPHTGRILSMVGFDKTNPGKNPCVARFPAASVFKIVTAAAAIEKCGLRSYSKIRYRGGKYTLYKYQLKKQPKRRANKITLKDSFAQSVNPVFGKIGMHYLKRNVLEKYASAFGFNKDISFEIPLLPSSLSLTDKPYHWAEIASGFNRETRISPLHGALIVSAILNKGRLAEPAIVDRITDENGHALYQGDLKIINQAITHETSGIVKNLMKATIKSGTCRKMFRGYRKDAILSKLNIGGKTGSINSRIHEGRRYDWFVGFAEEKNGTGKLAISVFIAHEKYIGRRSAQYARMIIKEYFRNKDKISLPSEAS